MEREQQNEWAEAQKIGVSVDLVEAAKKQLIFLAAVDRNRYLYEDHVLQWAIYRYNAFWLPLLAKHLENPVSEDPLVVPLDCEWIWHCHRLNPVRYKLDCEKLYGRILGNCNVISSVQATSKSRTEEIWNKMYPEEPYELDINRSFTEKALGKGLQNEKFTSYDLVSAVKRQISFTFQVSRPHMSDVLFLQEAEARYKGFLHLIRSNRKMGIKRFCVPTYDVDLMWHTHQLNPYYYCKDLVNLLGMVLEHDDTDSDRAKGSKLDNGFSETTKQWEETFGKRYWKAGAMYRGNTPTPVTQIPSEFRYDRKEINPIENCDKPIQLSARTSVEVFLEFVEIKNLPEVHKDNLLVSFSKKQSDKLFNVKRSMSIFSMTGEKQVAYFQCEPTGEFLFELKCQSPSDKSSKVLGSCSLSLQELLASRSQLSTDKWLSVDLVSGLKFSEPILLHVSVSFTPPTPAPHVFHLEQSQGSQLSFKSSCFLPLLKMGKAKSARTQTFVTDDDGKFVFRLEMRNIIKDGTKCTPELLKEMHYITDSGEKHQVAEFLGKNWVIRGVHGFFMLENNSGNGDHLFELVGYKMVKLFSGRRLDFEFKHGGNRCEQDFVTAVEFSTDHPYGRAIALFDIKLGTVKAMEEWIVLPGIILGFIMSDTLSREGYSGFAEQKAEVVMNESNQEKLDACLPDVQEAMSSGGDLCVSEETIEGGSCGGGKCGGGKCGSGKCGGGLECEAMGGNCGLRCGGGGLCVSEETIEDGSCGGGKCDGGKCGSGKCGGGKCGGGLECEAMGGNCGLRCGGGGLCFSKEMVEGGKCGGGKCGGGKCGGGKCGGGMEKSSVVGGSCGGKCGGKCGGGNCGAGKCGGGVEKSSVTGGKCGGGKCGGGKCGGGMDKSSVIGGRCGGGKCGGGKCGSGMERSSISGDGSTLAETVESANRVCDGGRCCGGVMPSPIASVMNVPAAA